MTGDESHGPAGNMTDIELKLTMHLERAYELGARMRRSNTVVEEELRRTRLIAVALRGVIEDND